MNVIKINKKRMIIFLIICVIFIILFSFMAGHAHITFKPFHITFERPFNLLGWVMLIVAGVFWQIDSCKVRDKEIRKETEEIEEIEKYYNNEFSRSLQDLKDKISKSNVDTTDVQLNNKNKTLDNGN